MSFLRRIFGRVKSAEGEYRDGPYTFPISGGWLPDSSPWNFWQTGGNVRPYGGASAMVRACIAAYAETAAMCPGDHWRRTPDGGRIRVEGSALTRILRSPNEYQSISDFMLNLTWSLYDNGNAYALALRNDRAEVAQLHLFPARQCHAEVAVDGSVFYVLAGNEIVERRFGGSIVVPARDVLHVRLHTPRHPLRGESPIMAAALDAAAGDAILQRQIAFFLNRAQPSIVLSSDEKLTAEQSADLRKRWEEMTTGANTGRTPILSWGIKPHVISNTAQDAQLAETMKMSQQNIALAFRVPLQILGIGGTPYASTEMLMQSWVASGLGFCLNHIEEAFGQLFRLRGVPDEYVEFNTSALLRSAFKDRIEGLARAVQGGIYSPDEARAFEDLPKVPGGYGEEPRVQQQVVPLSWHAEQAKLAAEAPLALPSPEPDEAPEDAERVAPAALAERLRARAALH